MRQKGVIHPTNGGCWYCHNNDDDMAFSSEFDTNVHIDCLREAVQDPDDPEAAIMANELLR